MCPFKLKSETNRERKRGKYKKPGKNQRNSCNELAFSDKNKHWLEELIPDRQGNTQERKVKDKMGKAKWKKRF